VATPTNLLQSLFLFAVLPVMGAGVVIIHARDLMGNLVLPCVVVYSLTALLIELFPA